MAYPFAATAAPAACLPSTATCCRFYLPAAAAAAAAAAFAAAGLPASVASAGAAAAVATAGPSLLVCWPLLECLARSVSSPLLSTSLLAAAGASCCFCWCRHCCCRCGLVPVCPGPCARVSLAVTLPRCVWRVCLLLLLLVLLPALLLFAAAFAAAAPRVACAPFGCWHRRFRLRVFSAGILPCLFFP